MYRMKKPADAYRKAASATQSPDRALIAAYDQCVTALVQSRDAMKEEVVDSSVVGHGVGVAHQVLFVLCGALDHEVYPEFSARMEQTYLGLGQSLTQAHMQNDVDGLTQVIDIINALRESWQDAVREKSKHNLD